MLFQNTYCLSAEYFYGKLYQDQLLQQHQNFLKQHMAVMIGMLNLNLYNMRSTRAVLHTRYNLFYADDDFVKDMLLYEFANPFATQHNNENVVFVLLLL